MSVPAYRAVMLTTSVKAADGRVNVDVVAVTVPVPPTAGVMIVNDGPLFCAIETKVVFVGILSVSEHLQSRWGLCWQP